MALNLSALRTIGGAIRERTREFLTPRSREEILFDIRQEEAEKKRALDPFVLRREVFRRPTGLERPLIETVTEAEKKEILKREPRETFALTLPQKFRGRGFFEPTIGLEVPIFVGAAKVAKVSKFLLKQVEARFGKILSREITNRGVVFTERALKQTSKEVEQLLKVDISSLAKKPIVEREVRKIDLPTEPFRRQKLEIDKLPDVVSLEETIQKRKVISKSFTQEGRILVDDKGVKVFPKDIKVSPTPLEKPVIVSDAKKVEKALEGVARKRGQTEIIIASLKKKGVSQGDIDNVVLENGDRLVDTIKVKREVNGVLSATIRKDTLQEIEIGFKGTKLDQKWIPTKTAIQKVREAGRTAKGAAIDYYELPQLFFDRTGLREFLYDPIREARRNASLAKTAIYNRFVDAGLMKRSGWFTADRFTISTKESENVARYYLTRQGKGGGKVLEDLSTKEREFVGIFDDVIKESEPRFFKVAELNGKSPGKVENYAPIMTSQDFKLAQEIGDMDFMFRKHPAFFSLKKRAEKVPFELYELDYRRIAVRWIDQMTAFNHLGEVGTQVKYLANSDEFREKVGDKVFKTTNKWLKDTFNPQVLTDAEKGLRLGRQAQSIASLGLNFASVVKQMLTILPISIIEKAPPKLQSKFAKDFGIKVADLPSITERKGNASIMDMQEGFRKIAVGPLAKFDQIVAQKELNALLDKNLSKAIKEGKEITPEVQAQILKKSQDTLDMWFGGMTPEQLPLAFRSELGKIINMFIMPLTSQLNGFIFSVMKQKGIVKAEKVAEVVAAAIGIAYMEQVITNLNVNWTDTREMVSDVGASLAGNIPLLSQIVFAFRTDQPVSPSPLMSAVGRLVQQLSKAQKDQADGIDVAFAIAELVGLPKQFRRTVQGIEIISEGGLRDKNGKLLVLVTGTDEKIRAFLRGKYGTIATQDWIRNIGIKTEQRRWFVPEVEFLQNGDYTRKAELFRVFDKETQDSLRAELSEGQQKRLDKALQEKAVTGSLESIFGTRETKTLESIFK